MKKQLEKMVGQVIAVQTAKGIEVGTLEKVTSEGITLGKVTKKDAKDLVKAENVFWGRGFYPYRGFGYPGMGFGYPGMGFGYPGVGFGGVGAGIGVGVGVGVGFGAGFGYRPGLFW